MRPCTKTEYGKYKISFPYEFREWRTKNKISQKRVADYLGICTRLLSQYEKGNKKIPDTIFKLMKDLVDHNQKENISETDEM